MNKWKTVALVLSAGMALASQAQAQSASQPRSQSVSEVIITVIRNSCPALISKLTEEPALATALKARPISVQSTCSCTEGKFAADSRLKNYLNADPETLKRRFQQEAVRSYVTLRLMEAALSCVSVEIEATIGATDLPQ